MKYFSTLLEASGKNVIEPKVLTLYIDKTAKTMPDDVKRALYIIKKYNMTDKDIIGAVTAGSSSDLKKIKAQYSISDNDLESLRELLKQISREGNLRMLPHMQSKEETDNVVNGKISLEDVALDLETERGRDAIAKKYIPLVNAIARKYEHKSSLSYEELVSAGMMGLMYAMQDYHKPGDSEEKSVPFKQYACYRIGFAIKADMNDSRTVRLPASELRRRRERGESLTNTISLDATIGDEEDGATLADILAQTMPDEIKERPVESDEKMWSKVTKFVEKNFGSRPASMFYKTLGINGFKRMKQVEIAKQMNCTKANVNIAVKKIVNAINSNPEMKQTIHTLMNYYTEALLIDNYKDGKAGIMEAFVNDDIYLMLEEMTHWTRPEILENALKNVLLDFSNTDATFIVEALKNDFAWLDDRYDNNKSVLVSFLESMNPTETYKHKTDVTILNAFTEIADAYKNSEIQL